MSKLASVKKFVAANKVTIAVATTAVICLGINRLALRQHNNFLRANDLYETFYAE